MNIQNEKREDNAVPRRKLRAQIAQETLQILEQGCYHLPDGTVVSIQPALQHAIDGTILLDANAPLPEFSKSQSGSTRIQVSNQTTLAAARNWIKQGVNDPVCLNFASAKHPGGGFISGSQAQEESLARASGLYACIHPVHAYYETNRHCGTCLYTDHMIYSPGVPVFRDDHDQLLEVPYLTAMITAPAVNAGMLLQNEPEQFAQLAPTMLQRIRRLLALALHHGHTAILLGAWGCGVFRNDPRQVAAWFHEILVQDPTFCGAFQQVEFAVLDTSADQDTYRAFQSAFA